MQQAHIMQSLNLWKTLHTYEVLANNGKAAPILCPEDKVALKTRAKGKNLVDPYLWCSACGSYNKPGLDLITKIRNVVKEHYNVTFE